ncbi:hypothetical protein, partial [Rhizobium sp. Pop5]|uniref:hypothetical protein n=1 Tax=Rhizobium sp. Pop5 TaxID=1223565 RepID=UPI00196A1634
LWFDILVKKEKRGRRKLAIPSECLRHFRGVLRFDGHLTGAIYVLKSTGRFISGDPKIRPIVLPIPQLP